MIKETKRRKKLPNYEKIRKELADIAFSEEEKTADRLRALDMLSDALSSKEISEEAYQKLDNVLNSFFENK